MRKVVAVVLIAVLAFCWLAFNRGIKVDVQCGPVVTTPLMTKGYRGAKTLGESLRLFTDGQVTPKDIVEGLMGMLHTISVYTDAIKRGFHDESDSKDGKAYERATRQAQSKALASCCPAAPVDPTPPGIEEPPNDGGEGGGDAPFDPKTLTFTATGQGQSINKDDQLALVAVSNAVGAGMEVSKRGQIISIGVMIVESNIQNLSYGHLDSLGPWQQRSSWGTVSERMQPTYGAKQFYKALLKVPNWETRPMGEVAQAVQVSGTPGAYQPVMDEAERWWARAGGADQAPLLDDPESSSTPAYCNPASAERNSDETGTPGVGGSLAAFTKATAEAQISNPRTPQQALAWLAKQQGNTSSRCLHFVAAAYGYNSTKPHPSPIDGGQWGADEQWRLIPAKYKHSPAEPAPPGAVMWWDGGNVDGHVALSLGNGMVRSTGVGAGGGVGDKPLAYFSGYGNYVGWSLPFWPDRSTIGVAA